MNIEKFTRSCFQSRVKFIVIESEKKNYKLKSRVKKITKLWKDFFADVKIGGYLRSERNDSKTDIFLLLTRCLNDKLYFAHNFIFI